MIPGINTLKKSSVLHTQRLACMALRPVATMEIGFAALFSPGRYSQMQPASEPTAAIAA